MPIEKILVPDLGEFDHVDVVEVLVAGGDVVEKDDSLITLESDKATMDVPSPLPGVVRELKVRAGDQVASGDLILTLEVAIEVLEEVAPPAPAEPAEPKPVEQADPAPVSSTPPADPGPPVAADEVAFTKAYASPAVRRYARELGVPLERVRGTGRKGRILREDVRGFVKKALSEPSATGFGPPPMPVVDFSVFGEVERRPLSRIQKISGVNLTRSWLNVPHVTQHDEADVTDLETFRREHSDEAKASGVKLTPLAFILRACVPLLQEFPSLNSSLDPDGEHLIVKRYIHMGFAADTPNGLLVPVIRNVDRKGIFEIAEELADLSARAREGKLKLDEMKGAGFTVTSLGGIGGTAFTPIVNAPEVAILGVSRTRMKPVWNGSDFEPRLMLPLSLSYDHRVIDGATAVRATTYLNRILGDIRRMLL